MLTACWCGPSECIYITKQSVVHPSLLDLGRSQCHDQARDEPTHCCICGTFCEWRSSFSSSVWAACAGEQIGTGHGMKVDIAVDPLDGTSLVAKGRNGAVAVRLLLAGDHACCPGPPDVHRTCRGFSFPGRLTGASPC